METKENQEIIPSENHKKCTKCGKWKLADLDHFHKRSASADGLFYWCKECTRPDNRIRANEHYRGIRRGRPTSDQPRQTVAAKLQALIIVRPGGCAEAMPGTVRLSNGLKVSAGRASWFLSHNELPKGRLRRLCMTPNCITPTHLQDTGHRTRAGAAPEIQEDLRHAITQLSDEGMSRRSIAKKFNISVGSVSEIVADHKRATRSVDLSWFQDILGTAHETRGRKKHRLEANVVSF